MSTRTLISHFILIIIYNLQIFTQHMNTWQSIIVDILQNFSEFYMIEDWNLVRHLQ